MGDLAGAARVTGVAARRAAGVAPPTSCLFSTQGDVLNSDRTISGLMNNNTPWFLRDMPWPLHWML